MAGEMHRCESLGDYNDGNVANMEFKEHIWVFEHQKADPHVACARALKLMEEFATDVAREQVIIPSTENDAQQWRKPSRGHDKLNSDATVKEGKCGVGVFFRDAVGDVLLAGGDRIEGVSSPEEAEARAILFGLQTAFDVGLKNLEVESDCLNVIKLLNGHKARTFTQVIVNDILALSNSFTFCSFSFAYRSYNKVAHSMAQLSLSYEEMRVWLEDHPPELLSLVLADKVLIP